MRAYPKALTLANLTPRTSRELERRRTLAPMWPLAIILGLAGVYLYSRYKGDAATAPHLSPNIVIKNGVQYVAPETPAQRAAFEAVLPRVARRGEPVVLNEGPLQGAAVLVYDVLAAPAVQPETPELAMKLMFSEIAALQKAAVLAGSESPLILASVDQLDAVLAKTPPKVLTLFVTAPALGLAGAKAPSAYAVLEQANLPKEGAPGPFGV